MTIAARRSWFEKREALPRAVTWRVVGAEAEPRADHGGDTEMGGGAGGGALDATEAGEGPAPLVPAISPEREALEAAEAAVVASAAALEKSREELGEARAALSVTQAKNDELAAEMRRAIIALRDEVEREVVKLAVAIAERVIGRELGTAPELVVQWAREVIAGSALGDHFEIALSTELASTITGEAWEDLASFVSTDPLLPPGTCEIREGGKVITVGAKTRLDLVSDHLATSLESDAA